MINNNKTLKILLLTMCVVHIGWTCCSIIYDYNNNYSASLDVANFLKQDEYKDKIIYGCGFDVTAILPYFEHNIFNNNDSGKSFWIWSKSNEKRIDMNMFKKDADIYVISNFYIGKYGKFVDEYLKDLKGLKFKQYDFNGYMYAKTFKLEDKGYIVLIKE